MKATARIMWVMGGSFLIVDLAYLIWSLLAENLEIVGLMTVGLSGGLCILMAFYFGRVVKAQGAGVLPEDRPDAEIDEGDAEVGFYSPWSWWPILLAAALGLLVTGVAISAWIALVALPFFVVCLIGLIFEYYRGYFVR